MRLLLATWTAIMFILTCTNDPYLLLEGEVSFIFNFNPHWSDLFTLPSLSGIRWIEFSVHVFIFFILTGILIGVFNRISSSIMIAILYGIGTELLQPFFSRGAEGIDLLADAVGIIAFVMLYSIVKISFMIGRKNPSGLDERMRDVM